MTDQIAKIVIFSTARVYKNHSLGISEHIRHGGVKFHTQNFGLLSNFPKNELWPTFPKMIHSRSAKF